MKRKENPVLLNALRLFDASPSSSSAPGLLLLHGGKGAEKAYVVNMAYILNKNIPANKRIKNALTAIYGIGEKRALEIAHELCFSPGSRFSVLSQTQISRISGLVQKRGRGTASEIRGQVGSTKSSGSSLKESTGSSLQKKINENVKVLMKIRCYRGLRNKNRLPVRGQRTHTNAQTQKKKKIMLSGR